MCVSLLLLLNTGYGKQDTASNETSEAKSETYQSYLQNTQQLVQKKFPQFFDNLNNEQQLSWIQYVSHQAGSYGYDNISQKQGFVLISCYLGKDFMTDKNVDSKIKRFLKDKRFSKYVRIRDIQRYLKRERYSLTLPDVVN